MKKTTSGFTIVELLIVIVVVAVLAAISVVAYNGIQQRARDTKRQQDVAQIAKLLQIYASNTSSPMWDGSGCGASGNGQGWFNYQDGAPLSYPKSMMQCLIDAGVTSSVIRDDSISCEGTSCRAYMKYTCTQSGQTVTYIFTNLETGTHNGTEANGTCYPALSTLYGMNYFVKIIES